MKSPVVLGRHWEQGWTSCLRQGACAASGGAGGRQGVSRLPTTRRDASLAHRSASFAAYYSPHVRYVRTYVRTLPLRPLSLSPPFPRSVPPRIHRRVEGARVRACVFLRGGILLQSFSPFTQCANIINGKVCIPVIGKREDRVVHRGCTISLGYSAVTVATRKVIPWKLLVYGRFIMRRWEEWWWWWWWIGRGLWRGTWIEIRGNSLSLELGDEGPSDSVDRRVKWRKWTEGEKKVFVFFFFCSVFVCFLPLWWRVSMSTRKLVIHRRRTSGRKLATRVLQRVTVTAVNDAKKCA